MRLVVDLHTHSVASGHAYSTVQEMAAAAAAKGLEAMALTDHGPGMPGGPHIYHFGNLRVLPVEINGVRILKGVEANIVDREGNLDLPGHYLQKLDIVLAGMHDVVTPSGSIEENTRAVLNALQNRYVDIITHPGNPAFAVDYDLVLDKAGELGVALEINNSSFCGSRRGSVENCRHIARLAAKKGNLIAVGSDAHYAPDVGSFSRALEVIKSAGIREEQILNLSVEKVLAYLAGRRNRRI